MTFFPDMNRWVNPLHYNALANFMRKAFEAGAIADAEVMTNAEWNNDFVQALREVKPEIEFSFTLTEGKPDKQ